MIVVIADDLSGAAELAGIAAARGLRAEVHRRFDPRSKAEVIAVDSGTRMLSSSEAAAKMEVLYVEVSAVKPDWIYKKTDSVLRGNVRSEIEGLLRGSGLRRALLIPANPGKDRVVRNGNYFVAGRPLHETVFAADPTHPCRTSNVVAVLGEVGAFPIRSIGPDQCASAGGIVIPDVCSAGDLEQRAGEVDELTLPAGAAEFFSAMLNRRTTPVAQPPPAVSAAESPEVQLFVCGSLAAWDQGIARAAGEHGVQVFAWQPEIAWLDRAAESLDRCGRAMLAIGRPPGEPPADRLLRDLVAGACRLIRGHSNVRVLVEGGATATALMESMGWTTFEVRPLGLVGVGCLVPLAGGLRLELFVKPGSYPWPEPVWGGAS